MKTKKEMESKIKEIDAAMKRGDVSYDYGTGYRNALQWCTTPDEEL